jgi:hypothetical protein
MSQLWEALMQTSRFQLGLIATLAVGLGFSLASSEAVGYPAGAVVSMGSNPTFSDGGIVNNSSASVGATEADQQMVITDVVLTMASSACSSTVQLVNTTTGVSAGAFKLHSAFTNNNGWGNPHRTQPTQVSHSFGSGLPVAPGESIEIMEVGGCSVAFAVAGYYAQP